MDYTPRKIRVAVVGAGVVGLSAALNLTQRFPKQLDVTVIADKFSPELVTDKAGMIMVPVSFEKKCGDEMIQKWTKETFSRFHSIYGSADNAEVQLCLRVGYEYQYSWLPDPWWKDLVLGFRHVELQSDEAHMIRTPPECVDVWAYSTYIIQCSNYLKWMTKQIQLASGLLVKKKVESLDELTGHDIIINCTGLGSRELLNDHAVKPARGQIVAVNAPWINHFFVSVHKDNVFYLLPRMEDIALGGSYEVGNWNETPDPELAQKILKGCQTFVPSLSEAEPVGGWAGLRPLRDGVRMESNRNGPNGSLLIHCYGHGGQGIVLSWGCALEIGNMVEMYLSSAKAKL